MTSPCCLSTLPDSLAKPNSSSAVLPFLQRDEHGSSPGHRRGPLKRRRGRKAAVESASEVYRYFSILLLSLLKRRRRRELFEGEARNEERVLKVENIIKTQLINTFLNLSFEFAGELIPYSVPDSDPFREPSSCLLRLGQAVVVHRKKCIRTF